MKTAFITIALRCLAVSSLCSIGSAALAQDLGQLHWGRKLEHYTPAEAPAYDVWVITSPFTKSEQSQDQSLAAIAEAISHETNTRIAHIFLGDLVRTPEIQAAVMNYVSVQPEFLKNPPPTGFGHWEFKNSTKLRALVEQGLLQSPFVKDCNEVLGKYDKAVKSVSMEKLFFTKKDGKWGWDAIVWLKIDPPPAKDATKAKP